MAARCQQHPRPAAITIARPPEAAPPTSSRRRPPAGVPSEQQRGPTASGRTHPAAGSSARNEPRAAPKNRTSPLAAIPPYQQPPLRGSGGKCRPASTSGRLWGPPPASNRAQRLAGVLSRQSWALPTSSSPSPPAAAPEQHQPQQRGSGALRRPAAAGVCQQGPPHANSRARRPAGVHAASSRARPIGGAPAHEHPHAAVHERLRPPAPACESQRAL